MAYVIGAVLAAGSGVRMGGPKATLVVDGQRLIDRAIAALAGGGCDQVIAVVGEGVTVDGASVIVNPAPERGMRSSLALAVDTSARLGVHTTSATELDAPATGVGLAVLLVDTPGIDAAAVHLVVERWRVDPARIAVGRFNDDQRGGRRGHPTVMGLAHWQSALLIADPDEGARRYLNANSDLIDEVLVDGDPADLDRPEDLQTWRDRHHRESPTSRLADSEAPPF